MKKTEILTPAGSFESLVAGINASCDAVYIGGTKFGARAFADNFDEKTLCKAIDYAHLHGKKIYLTINTLLKNRELERELFTYLHPYYVQGIDAVIIQDMGVLSFIHEYFPDLPIHASTQMSITQAWGGEMLKEFGITRLVNARELSVEEVHEIRKNTDLEIESFVHGALCYCYSGQCLMSSMIGGRSGNRGRCAQPCRMAYDFKVDGKSALNQSEKYLLSPKDMSALSLIPKLIEAGIDSFKIEGRMKRPEYAAGVTSIYRKYVDRYYEFGPEKYEKLLRDNEKETKQDEEILMDLYNRGGFSKGYYETRNSKSMISLTRPNHSGVLVGKVKEVKGNQAFITLVNDINGQDILEIRDNNTNLYEFTVKAELGKGKTLITNFNKGLKIKVGNFVYRTKNNELLKDIGNMFLKEQVKESMKGILNLTVNKPLKLILTCKEEKIEIEGEMVSEALNQPLTEEKIRKQMSKTNDTAFYFEALDIQIQGNVFVPVQKLNEIRREGIAALEQKICESYRRKAISSLPSDNNFDFKETKKITGITVLVNTIDQLMEVLKAEEVTHVYMESDMVPLKEILTYTNMIKEAGKHAIIALPHVFRVASSSLFRKYKDILMDNTIDGYLVRNYEEYYFLTKIIKVKEKTFISDYHLYVYNQRASEFFKYLGFDRINAPLELNYSELKELKGSFQELLVYGYLPLMVSAQCLYKTAAGGDNTTYYKENANPCCYADVQTGELVDRYQKKFRVKRRCRECYNIIYNSQCYSLLSNYNEVSQLGLQSIRLDFTSEGAEETKQVLHKFIEGYFHGTFFHADEKEYTRGHFKRGVD